MSFQTVGVVSLLVAFGVIMLHDIFFVWPRQKRARKAFITALEKFLRERTEFSKDDFVEVANVPYLDIPLHCWLLLDRFEKDGLLIKHHHSPPKPPISWIVTPAGKVAGEKLKINSVAARL